jgi:hypothetical protein
MVSLSLKSHTPVISDWIVTEQLGMYWSMLPTNLEEMTLADRKELAIQQATSYKAKTPDIRYAADRLLAALRSKK